MVVNEKLNQTNETIYEFRNQISPIDNHIYKNSAIRGKASFHELFASYVHFRCAPSYFQKRVDRLDFSECVYPNLCHYLYRTTGKSEKRKTLDSFGLRSSSPKSIVYLSSGRKVYIQISEFKLPQNRTEQADLHDLNRK